VVRRWASLGELATMPRQVALDTIDLLDAYEEAEDAAAPPDPPKRPGGG
jgi:hypothetical protein